MRWWRRPLSSLVGEQMFGGNNFAVSALRGLLQAAHRFHRRTSQLSLHRDIRVALRRRTRTADSNPQRLVTISNIRYLHVELIESRSYYAGELDVDWFAANPHFEVGRTLQRGRSAHDLACGNCGISGSKSGAENHDDLARLRR